MRKTASILVVIGVAVAASLGSRADAAELDSACVQAGLQPPSLMKPHFELTDGGPVHRNVTFPRIHYRYRIAALPAQCRGKAIQKVEVKVQYKTSQLATKTLWVWQDTDQGGIDDHKKTWMSLYSGDAGTGLPGGDPIPASGNLVLAECAGDGFLIDFGTVQVVSAIERRSVKEVGSGSIWTKTHSLPVTFSPKRKHDTSGHSVCYQTELAR